MPMPISQVLPVAPLEAAEAGLRPNAPSAAGAQFREALRGAIERVDQYRATADQITQQFLSGEGGELHSVVLATQQAEMSFELFQQVRNKVVQAYQEVMRMQM